MKFIRLKTKKLIFSALCALILCCAVLGGTLLSNSSEAIDGVPDATTVGAIYDFDKYCYDADELDKLARAILPGQSSSYSGTTATFRQLESYALSQGENGTPVNRKDLTVKYGHYRFNDTGYDGDYNDLVWMPVYLSKSVNGDAILTLYLAGNDLLHSASMQERSTFMNNWTATVPNSAKNPSSGTPSNNYGISYMRAVSVGAGSQYTTYGSSIGSQTPSITTNNKFSNFIQGKDFTGEFYGDIASPNEISWQANESYAAHSANFSLDSGYANNIWPNEAYGTPSTGSYYQPSLFDYSSKTQYTDWQFDKVWLPSLTEVGDADVASGSSSYSGIWQLNNYQRQNCMATWLRTAKTTASRDGNPYSTYTMFAINTDGTIGELDVNVFGGTRPAIHLNLSKIANGDKTTPALNPPAAITSVYDGNSLGQTIANVSEDQKAWYTPNASKLDISYWSDEGCTKRVQPIDAGTYYMMIRITDTSGSLRFYNPDPKDKHRKVIKFVIEKAMLELKWEYERNPENDNDDSSTNQVPVSVDFTDGAKSKFAERDEGFIPELGFYYQSIEGGATKYYDGAWPEKMGSYYAYAYIKDESLYNYNYTIDAANTESRSNSFYVGLRTFGMPQFCYFSEDAVAYDGNTRLYMPYKGRNYVQINNITPNMKVTVTASNEAAQKSIVDIGPPNGHGIKTFEITNVGSYTFTVSLSATEQANGHWPDNSVGSKELTLVIQETDITVTFDGLPASWGSLTDQQFTLNVIGLQAGDNIDIDVYYVKSGGTRNYLYADEEGVYTIKERNVGEYTLVAVLATGGYEDIPYKMETAVQKFKITQASSSFKPEYINWQYKNGDKTEFIERGNGDTPDRAIQLDYTGKFYEFSLQMDEARLRDSYLVRATYTPNAYVKDAGVYSVMVTVSAYDKNIQFDTITGTLYFTINPFVPDITDVEWNHADGVIFRYDGTTEFSVLLENVPDGLVVSYTANRATATGAYRAIATFSVSEDYAKNYKAPTEPMYLNWSISESGTVPVDKEYDTANLTLTVTHGGEPYAVLSWNNEQKKWFDGGEEYALSFPYDGKEYKLELDGEVPGLVGTPGLPSNNVFTDADTYRATFPYYGSAEFGTIEWTIEKANINFSNVRWGYIDEAGNEFDMDFDKNPFYFTVADGTAVKYTVGLIGLPEGIKVTYTTDSLTDADSKGMQGSTFATIGDYETRLNRSIVFESGMASNYATTRIPVTITQVQFWRIVARDYVPISKDNSWTKFDSRTHNLIDMCSIPYSQLEYFRVEVLFLDGGGNLYQQYEGYEGQQYYGYHAGEYTIRFYEYRGMNADGSLQEFSWGRVEFKVAKADLSVSWDQKGEIPVARVANMNTSGMIETKYFDADNKTVNEAYIKARPGVPFYAEAVITDEYKDDIQIVMDAIQPQKLEFTYEAFVPDTQSRPIDRADIYFDNPRIEYDGKSKTFSLHNWSVYSQYLYYEGDSLTQLRAGDYIIYVSFLKGANAYWAGSGNYDRSTIELHFSITSPTRFGIDYPLIESDVPCFESDSTSMKFIAGKAITLNIANWNVLQDFVTYTVTDKDGKDYGQWLTYTAVGEYTIKFTIPSDSIGYWKLTDGKEEYVFTFTIELPSDKTALKTPQFKDNITSQVVTGQPITFQLDNEETYFNYCDFSGDSLTQSAVGSYSVTIMIKAQYGGLKFTNGMSYCTLNFSIRATGSSQTIVIPEPIILGASGSNRVVVEYTGNEVNIVSNWAEMSQYVDAGILSSNGVFTSNDAAYLIWKEIGDYVVRLRIKPEYADKAVWADGTSGEKVINFVITNANVDVGNSGVGSDGKFTAPNGDKNNVNFDDFFDYTYYDKDGNPVKPEDLKDGEEYTVEISLKPGKEQDFANTFVNSEEILNTIRNNNPYSFTYDSGETDYKLLKIIIIAEVAVLVFLIIATIIVLLVQNKTLKEMENEYDRYNDYEEDDDY